MRFSRPRWRSARANGALLVAGLTLALAGPLAAQGSGDGYLFHEPFVRLAFRGGYAIASAGSDIFQQTTQDFTLNKRSFSSLTGGAEVGFRVTPRLQLGADVGVSNATHGSEYRHFIDNNDRPIEQTTMFTRVPVMANVRYLLAEPGLAVGSLAWIPAHVVPWVGAGGGAMWYRFRQEGDFFYTSTSRVYTSTVRSTGWSPAAQGMAGVDVGLTPHLSLTGDARYIWSRAPMDGDFQGFDKIDLSGVSMTVGATFRL